MPETANMSKLNVKWNKTVLDVDITPDLTVEDFKGVICSLTNVRREVLY